AMATTGAAERDREVALPFASIAGQRELEQLDEAPQELLRLVAAEHVVRDRRIASRLVAQRLHEVRVGEKTAVQHQIRVGGQAVLVSEGEEPERHRARLGPIDEVAQRAAELVHRERARVEDAVGKLPQAAQLLPLATDAVGDAAPLVGGVGSPRLAETADEHLVARFEGEHLERDVLLPEPVEDLGALRQPIAHARRPRARRAAQGGGAPPRRGGGGGGGGWGG